MDFVLAGLRVAATDHGSNVPPPPKGGDWLTIGFHGLLGP